MTQKNSDSPCILFKERQPTWKNINTSYTVNTDS